MELIGIFVPALVDTINTTIRNTHVKFWVAFMLCAVLGTAINGIETSFVYPSLPEAFESVTASIMVVFGLSQITYNAGYKNSEIRKTFLSE